MLANHLHQHHEGTNNFLLIVGSKKGVTSTEIKNIKLWLTFGRCMPSCSQYHPDKLLEIGFEKTEIDFPFPKF
jgi:hypothetical protein